jgi:O-antigen/teichoic acid export membrane protein
MEVLLPAMTLGSFIVIDLTAGMTVERAVYAWSLSFVPPLLAGYVLVGFGAWPHSFAAPAMVFRVLRFGVQAQLGNLIQFLNYRLDQYLILVFVSTAGVGLYSIGVSLSEGLWFIAHSVAIVLTTNLTTLDEAYARGTMPIVCRNTLLVTALASLAIGLVSPLAIPLVFGPDFEGSVVPFLLLLPGTVALAGTKILAAYVFSRGKPMLNAAIALVTLLVTIVGDLALLPLLGVEGAAIAASLAYVTSLTLTSIAYRRLSGGSILDALVPRPSDARFYVDGLRRALSRLRPAASGLEQSS